MSESRLYRTSAGALGAAVLGSATPRNRSARLTVIRPGAGRLRPGALLGYLRTLPSYSDLLWTLALHRLRVRYRQSLLGWAWAVLQPLLLMLIFTVLFALTAPRMPSAGLPYPVFVYAAVLPWTFFSTALSNGTGSLVGHAQLVTKVWFPREWLPLSYLLAALFDFVVASLLLVGLMLYHGVTPSWWAAWSLPIVALLGLLALALALALGALQVRYRDIGLAMPLLLQVWMFLSPVVYPLDRVPQRLRWLYELNPMVGLIDSFRRVTVLGQPPLWDALLVAVCEIAILLPACYLYFRVVDATVADRL